MSRKERHKQKVIKDLFSDNTKLPRKDNMDSFQIIMILSFFAAVIQILACFQKLDLSLFNLIKSYSLFLGLSFLIPISLYRKRLTMSFYEYIIYNIITIAPGVLAILFTLNASFSSPTYTEKYKIITTEHTEFKTTYTLENNTYKDKEYLRSINDKDEVEISGHEFLSIHFSDGLFGIRLVIKKELH